MIHFRHRWQEKNRQYGPAVRNNTLAMLIGQPVNPTTVGMTLVTYKCEQCPKHKQVFLTGNQT